MNATCLPEVLEKYICPGFFLSSESSDISFDIPQQAITLATMAQKASGDEDDNSSLCPVARTQFIVYKSAVLFQDKSLSSNGDGLTTVESGVISAQAGTDSVSSLSKPVEFSSKIDKPLEEVISLSIFSTVDLP